jgi:plastocyanin domain-containing protein
MSRRKGQKSHLKNQANIQFIFVAISGALILFLLIGIFILLFPTSETKAIVAVDSSVVQMENGVQIINMKAKNGFTPSDIVAYANMPTILRVQTSNTIDCSNTVRIPKLGISQPLTFNGTTDINIPPAEKGQELVGTCGMAHYVFKIRFI